MSGLVLNNDALPFDFSFDFRGYFSSRVQGEWLSVKCLPVCVCVCSINVFGSVLLKGPGRVPAGQCPADDVKE